MGFSFADPLRIAAFEKKTTKKPLPEAPAGVFDVLCLITTSLPAQRFRRYTHHDHHHD
jgi:hypothetical protein